MKRFHIYEKLTWVFVITVIIFTWWYTLDPVPYEDVNPVKIEYVEQDHNIEFVANFVKNTGCNFNRIISVGSYFNNTEILDYTDFEEGRTAERYDRIAGSQTLSFLIHLERDLKDYDWIELRTRHLCGDGPDDEKQKVDKVFYRINTSEL